MLGGLTLATVGSALLLLVLALVTYATVASVVAGLRRDRRLMRSAGNAVMAAFVCTVSAVVLLEIALVRHDFSIAVVLQHTSLDGARIITQGGNVSLATGLGGVFTLDSGANGTVSIATAAPG